MLYIGINPFKGKMCYPLILNSASLRISSRFIRDYCTKYFHRSFKASPSGRYVSVAKEICRIIDTFNKDCIFYAYRLVFHLYVSPYMV
jgi:hypothetical protein